MDLSSNNQSEIQKDLSNLAFNWPASYTQIEKLCRKADWLKHQIANAIGKNEDVESIETLISNYQDEIKKLYGYGNTYYYKEYQKILPTFYKALEDKKNED